MANKKISQLPSTQTTLAPSIQNTDQFPIARGGNTYNIFGSDIRNPILSAAQTTMLTKVNSLSAKDSATIDLEFNSANYALSANPLPGLIHSQTQITSLTGTDEFLVWSTLTESLRKINYEDFGYDKSKLCVSIGESRMTVSSYGNSFFIMQDGTLRSCGVNRNGAIGTGRANNEKVTLVNLCSFNPVVSSTDKVVKVVTNYDTSYAITSSGKLYGTGYNTQGQLGLGDTTARFVFTQITGGTPAISTKVITDIQAGTGNSSGSNAVHVLTQDGLVYAFGDGTSGSLGLNSTTNVNSNPVRVTTGIGSKIITQILTLGGGNYATAFALANDGTVWSAGDNSNGQLGRTISTASDKWVFKQITTLTPDPIVKLWGSGDNQYSTVWARGTSGKIYGWGYNGSYRAVGNNSTADVTLPIEITALAPSGGGYVENIYGSVDSNSVTLFAKYTNGTIKSWGRNSSGQLGTGNTTAVNSPSVIGGWPFSSSDVKDIAVAASSSATTTTAILLNDGTVYTAGYGTIGTLGNGTTTAAQTTFQKALFEPKVGTPIQIIMGNHDTANQMFFKALLNNGKVLAWGYQSSSTPQLGTDATPNSEFTPVQVLFF